MSEILDTNAQETEDTAPIVEDAGLETDIDDDWGDIDLSDIKDDDSDWDEEESEPEEEPEADQQTEPDAGEEESGPEAEPSEADKPVEEQKEADQQLFDLKQFGEVRKVTLDEMTALAQKGLNWDHVVQEREAARQRTAELEGFLQELAAPNGISIEELMDRTRAEVIAEREGIDKEVAYQRVKLDRDRRDFDARQRQQEEQQRQAQEQQQRNQNEFLRFSKEYPDVEPKAIPKEVWDSFSKGDSLVDAYARYENKQLKNEIQRLKDEKETAEQNLKNKERSVGSQQSAGGKKKPRNDEIDEDWYDGT